MTTTGESAPEGFSKAAESYDAAVRHNIAGSERLVMSLPDGDYARVLDVGCELDQRIEAELHARSGPDGFVYDYCKLFAVARKVADAG